MSCTYWSGPCQCAAECAQRGCRDTRGVTVSNENYSAAMEASPPVSIADQIACVRQELAEREKVLRLPVRSGPSITIEERDVWIFTRWRWTLRPHRNTIYLCRREGPRGGALTIHFHREIIAAPAGVWVDHANGDGLDARRGNLRLATRQQNSHNTGQPRTATNEYLGVRLHRASGLFQARLRIAGEPDKSSYHRTPEAAARARDAMALRYRGEFARLNFGQVDRADYEIAAMRAVLETLEDVQAKERLL